MNTKFIQKISAVLVVVIIAATVQSCTESKGNDSRIPKTSEPVPVRVLALEKHTSTESIVTSGRITTDDETLLSFKVGGVVKSVLVKEGDRVSKGQLLATLDLTEINATVWQARLGLEKAERDMQRAQNLYRDSVATLEQLENAKTAYDVASAQFKTAEFNRSFSGIRAPANGFVLKKFVNPGQVVGVGDPVLQTNGAGRGQWILEVGVSDKQWSAINVGDAVQLKLDAFDNELFTGSVIRKAETSDAATGSFIVEISLKENGRKLGSGMFGKATIKTKREVMSWNVPYEAVLDANGNEGFVFISNDNKVALKQPVTIASFDGETIQVTRGLENAKTLIISGSAYLTDESQITIVE